MENKPAQNLNQEAARVPMDHLNAADAVERFEPRDDEERALILKGVQRSRQVSVTESEHDNVVRYSDGSERVYDEDGIDFELPA